MVEQRGGIIVKGIDFQSKTISPILTDTIDGAVSEIIADERNRYHQITLPLEGNFKVRTRGERWRGDEEVELEYCGQIGSALRSVDGHHAVSTDHRTFCYLIVNVADDHDDSILDRGVCWVHSGSPGILAIGIKNVRGNYGFDEVKSAVQDAILRTVEVIRDILGTSAVELS